MNLLSEFKVEKNNLSTFIIKISTYGNSITLTNSPVANCQTFSIGRVQHLRHFSNKQIIDLFISICKIITRKQIICDVKEIYCDGIIKKLKLVSTKILKKKYKSTNGSIMYLLIVQLDYKKLRTIINENKSKEIK